MNEPNGSHINEQSAAAPKNRHVLTAEEQRHIAEVRTQIENFESDVLRLKGAIWDKQAELSFMRRHLSVYLGVIASNAGLPLGAQLSPDGSVLIAREG